jgi:beta-lactamase regulating signal transducer with metallopeptidase domain
MLVIIKPISASLKLKHDSELISKNSLYYFFLGKAMNITGNITINDKEIYIINLISLFLFLSIILFATLIIFYQNNYLLKKLKMSGVLIKCTDKNIITFVEKYSRLMHIKKPEIYFAMRHDVGFFTIGLKKNAIILNKEVMNYLSTTESETIILHELSHIKRHDNILNIFLFYLNLINFYNPFTYFAYSLIKEEQEKDCDKIVMKYLKMTGPEVAKNILSLILKIKSLPCKFTTSSPKTASFFSLSKKISEIKIKLRIKSLLNPKVSITENNLCFKIIFYTSFIILLFL